MKDKNLHRPSVLIRSSGLLMVAAATAGILAGCTKTAKENAAASAAGLSSVPSNPDDIQTQVVVLDIMTKATELPGANGSYNGITPAQVASGKVTGTDLTGMRLSTNCSSSVGTFCMATGQGNGYSYLEACGISSQHTAWIMTTTDASKNSWYGKAADSCPSLGDPGSVGDQPNQKANWSGKDFPS